MRRNSKTKAALLFTLLFTVVVSFTAFTAIVSAESGDKDSVDKKEIFKDVTESGKTIESWEDPNVNGVHADPAVFEKNFCLSVAEKEYTIKEIEGVISYYIDRVEIDRNKKMSDLEKYYTLGKWTNQRVVYDTDFWPAGYNLDYYRHQWDAYGAINEDEKSVCAGIAVFYANMCHAAGLPCKFVRLDPKVLDHTITYIPDINGHAYYADITENDFLMSKEACWFASDADLGFSGITEENADDHTFEYRDQYGMLKASDIKDCWQDKISYQKWFKEYALHKGTNKKFITNYVEQGSGDGTAPRAYKDFDKQPYESRTEAGDAGRTTGIWFLDDFYAKPMGAMSKILNKELDEQFLNISELNENYDCDSPEELEDAVNSTISIKYFPSVDENNNIVAKADELTNGEDYTVSCSASDFDLQNGEAVITITGKGGNEEYKGTYQVPVKLHSAVVKTPPTRINGLVYNGKSQKLIEPGEAENGTMLYAACKPGSEPAANAYNTDIPEGINAGNYDIWYMVKGDTGYKDMPPQKLIIPNLASEYIKDRPVRIVPRDIEKSGKIKLSKTTFTYNGKVQKPSIKANGLKAGTDYKVEGWENASSKNVGDYSVKIVGMGNYDGDIWGNYQIIKAANPMKLKAKTAKVKRSKVKKKAQTIKRAKVITVSKAKGKLSYKLVSAKKGKKSFKKKFKINAKTGNVTVKKGLKKGTYKVKVKAKAAGNASYKASAWKNVTFKIRVK